MEPIEEESTVLVAGKQQGALFAGLELRQVDRRLVKLPKNCRLVITSSSDRASEGKFAGPCCGLHRSPQLNLPRRAKRVQLVNNDRAWIQTVLQLAIRSNSPDKSIRFRAFHHETLLIEPQINNRIRTSKRTGLIKHNRSLITRTSSNNHVRGMLTLNRSKIQRQGTKQARLAILTRQPNKGLPSLTTPILINSQQLSNESTLPRLERKRLPKPPSNSVLNVLTAPSLKMLSRQHLPTLPNRPGLPLSNRAINSLKKMLMPRRNKRSIPQMLLKRLCIIRRRRPRPS